MLNSRLERAVAKAAGIPSGDIHILQCSSAGATGAIILHAWVGREKYPRIVVKTPRDPRLRHALRHEWDAVSLMRNYPALVDLIPAGRAIFNLDGADYYAYEGLSGRTMAARFRDRLFLPRRRLLKRLAAQALEVAVLVHGTNFRLAGPDEIARDLLVDLEWLEATLPSFPAHLSAYARTAADTLAASDHALPCGRVHGDFSPYNLMTGSAAPGATVRLIDWEHTEAERPQHLDVLRFMSAYALMSWRTVARETAVQVMSAADNPLLDDLLKPWLTRMHAGAAAPCMDTAFLQALWWHYRIHAARREQERLARRADHREPTYLRGLMALAASS